MDPYKRSKLNKILIIIAVVLIIIAIIVVILCLNLKNEKEKIIYEDRVISKNYFVEITANMQTKEIKRDGIETTLVEELGISEEDQNFILGAKEQAMAFFEGTPYEIKFEGNTLYITNKYQTKCILLSTNELRTNLKAEEVTELQGGIYLLRYNSQTETKAAYEYFSSVSWVERVETDNVQIIKTLNDESQTMYGEKQEENKTGYKSYGTSAMGLDNYQKIIKENGNAKEIVIATIGYGACIDNTYFNGIINEKYYNFIDNSKNIHETIPQGSRILEVIKESTTDNVKILPLVVINDENYATTSSIAKALTFAAENSDVICYEFINEESQILNKIFSNIFKSNIPVCCVSAPEEEKNIANENSETEEHIQNTTNKGIYPANNGTTIAVSSIDKTSKVTSYSGNGDYIDFVAHSTDVEEIFNFSSTISRWSGAQYSNAHIASAIALIKTYNKEATILDIYNFLRNYCKDLGETGKDDIYGYGCPNFSELKISEIDKTPTEIKEINFDNENWEKEKNIQIKSTDNIRVYGWNVTQTTETPTEWNTLEVLTHELDVTTKIEKNGNYYVWVTDSAGNPSYRYIEVNKIDSTEPKIEYIIDDTKKEQYGYITINVTATDEESGLNEMPYSWDNKNWGNENNTLNVSENGRYTIYVRDMLGNMASKEIVIKAFEEEGVATIGEGNIIKSIVVSSNWNEDINSSVRITFNDDLNIMAWRITESNQKPEEFTETTQNNNNNENQNSIQNNTQNNNNQNNITNNTQNNIQNNIINNTQNSGVQGYTNMTITVSLKANRVYYAWVKDTNGNVLSQSFTINKAEI